MGLTFWFHSYDALHENRASVHAGYRYTVRALSDTPILYPLSIPFVKSIRFIAEFFIAAYFELIVCYTDTGIK
ncbi:MAG: hypothetical protein ACXW4M_00980 [Anaerolineales bacterium]